MIVEIVKYRLKENVMDEDFAKAAEAMRKDFLLMQKGLIGHELLKTKEGHWADLLHWQSEENARHTADHFLDHPSCRKFEEMIEPDTAEITRANVII